MKNKMSAHKGTYSHETVRPQEAPEGVMASDMYAAKGALDYTGEFQAIACGKFGHKGAEQDRARIAPYMMYNDSKNQEDY